LEQAAQFRLVDLLAIFFVGGVLLRVLFGARVVVPVVLPARALLGGLRAHVGVFLAFAVTAGVRLLVPFVSTWATMGMRHKTRCISIFTNKSH